MYFTGLQEMVVRGSSKEKTWPDVIWEITEDITEDTPALNNLSAQPQSLRWALSLEQH